MSAHPGWRARRGAFHAAAVAATGLDDFGADDYGAGLEVFLDSLDRDCRLSDPGRAMTDGQITMFLASRLHTEAGCRRRPDALDRPVVAPLIITGIVRSGTTALHKLLSMDPQFQGLEHWLTRAPQPRPPRAQWLGIPAYRAAAGVVGGMIDAAPEMRDDHMMSADEVEESIFLLPQTFTSNMFPSQWDVPGYDAWYRAQDETPTYHRFYRNLQLIGADADQRWLLKNPTDLWSMQSVLNVFPDALVVQTHRDPLQAIPSISGLIAAARRLFEGEDADPRRVGERETEFWAQALDRMQAARARTTAPVFDLEFDRFVTDPLAAVRAIYAHFGLSLTGDVAATMQAWLEAHPRRQSPTRPPAAAFGLTEPALRDRYAAYRAQRGYT